MRRPLDTITYGNNNHFNPIDLSAKWQEGVISKVKAVRCIALPGLKSFRHGDYLLPEAVGLLEFTGQRAGAVHTEFVIGFTSSPDLPPPTFSLDDNKATGTLSLPASLFGPFLQIAQQPNAHFRLSSEGTLNSLASDPAMFSQPE